MNKWDARIFLFLLGATFMSILLSNSLWVVGFGIMSLAWATAMQKH